jgi:altronate dehydratase small subunit
MLSKGALVLSATDNVATAIEEIAAGSEAPVRLGAHVRLVRAVERIPFGFKIALADIPRGGQVVKYGEVIGVASLDIRAGQLVHVHNLEGARGRGDLPQGGAA